MQARISSRFSSSADLSKETPKDMSDKTSAPKDQPWWMCAAVRIRVMDKVEQFLSGQGDMEDQSSLKEPS